MHLYGATLDRYVAGTMDEKSRSALDAHISNCVQCAQGLAETELMRFRWHRRGWLGRLVRVDASEVAVSEREMPARAA